MFVCVSNWKLRWSEEMLVLNFCKITEMRQQKIKVEILHDLKEFIKKII